MTTPWSIEFHENILDRSVQARKHKGEESPCHCFVLDSISGQVCWSLLKYPLFDTPLSHSEVIGFLIVDHNAVKGIAGHCCDRILCEAWHSITWRNMSSRLTEKDFMHLYVNMSELRRNSFEETVPLLLTGGRLYTNRKLRTCTSPTVSFSAESLPCRQCFTKACSLNCLGFLSKALFWQHWVSVCERIDMAWHGQHANKQRQKQFKSRSWGKSAGRLDSAYVKQERRGLHVGTRKGGSRGLLRQAIDLGAKPCKTYSCWTSRILEISIKLSQFYNASISFIVPPCLVIVLCLSKLPNGHLHAKDARVNTDAWNKSFLSSETWQHAEMQDGKIVPETTASGKSVLLIPTWAANRVQSLHTVHATCLYHVCIASGLSILTKDLSMNRNVLTMFLHVLAIFQFGPFSSLHRQTPFLSTGHFWPSCLQSCRSSNGPEEWKDIVLCWLIMGVNWQRNLDISRYLYIFTYCKWLLGSAHCPSICLLLHSSAGAAAHLSRFSLEDDTASSLGCEAWHEHQRHGKRNYASQFWQSCWRRWILASIEAGIWVQETTCF